MFVSRARRSPRSRFGSGNPEARPTRKVDPAGTLVELRVEVDRRVDHREERERLREVAELFSGRPDLLGEQAEVVRVRQHLLEREASVLEAAGPSQRVDVPERTDRERPFGAAKAVRGRGRVVSIHEAVRDELAVHRLERREPPRIRWRHERDEGHQQVRRIEDVRIVVLDERGSLLAPAALHALLLYAVTPARPAWPPG